MAVKTKQLREMSEKELNSKLLELRKELMKLNAQAKTGSAPKNSSQIRVIRKTIAKILTILKEKERKEENKKE
ncbi:MAG: 50S ribosomal protein L29 [Candidatus Woesearchaeota archaeon]